MSQTDTEVGPREDGTVGVRLAHPLSPEALERLYLPRDTEANVGHVINVRPDQAMSLIGAGYVQVDPSDKTAVTEIVHGAESASLAVQPSSTSDNDATPTEPGAPRQEVVAGAGEGYDSLEGDALKQALTDRGLPQKGTADEKRAAVAAYDAEHPEAPQG